MKARIFADYQLELETILPIFFMHFVCFYHFCRRNLKKIWKFSRYESRIYSVKIVSLSKIWGHICHFFMHKTIFWTVRFMMKWKTKGLKNMLKNQINWFRLYFIADGFIKWKVSVLKSLGTPYSCWHELIFAEPRNLKRDENKSLSFLKRKNSYQSFAKLKVAIGKFY